MPLVVCAVLALPAIAVGIRNFEQDDGASRVYRGEPSPQVELRQVDGGPNYNADQGMPAGKDFFPIAAWFRPAQDADQLAMYKDFGLNMLVGVENPESANEQAIRAAGIKTVIQAEERTRFNDLGSEVAGWLLGDEQDMEFGPGDDTWNAGASWPNNCTGRHGENQDHGARCGFTAMDAQNASLPKDGRARWNNFGKGVLWWATDAQAARFTNLSQLDIVSGDTYWMTDPNESSNPRYGLPSSYGWNVDRMRSLDGRDGRRKAIWNLVETGWPYTQTAAQGARRILPAEARAAVWHSIIAGARGIEYFDHNFNGPCAGSTILGTCYADTRTILKDTNLLIAKLAPVLNGPTVVNAVTGGPVRTLTKWDGRHFYVFAGATGTRSASGTWTLSCVGDATAVKLGDFVGARTLPVVNGRFSDSFAGKHTVHIYRIDGGSTCGLESGAA